MQLLEWIILPLFIVVFMPRESHAAMSGRGTDVTASAEISDIPGNSPLDSFISFLKIHAGDLAESGMHITYDKKTFLRLHFHSGYHRPHISSGFKDVLIPDMFIFSGLHGVEYYIYTLQRIMV